MNILCVEPTKLYHGLLKLVFEDTNAEVVAVLTGQEGLDLLSSIDFELICVSYQLGDMDSSEFLQQVKQQDKYKNTPTVLITSSDSQELRNSSLELGFTEILNKTDISSLSRGLTRIVNRDKTSVVGTVLYVEDTEEEYETVKMLLKDMGLEIDHFTAAEEAMKSLDKKDYDIIITDIVLEGKMTGLGLVNEVRDRDDYKSTLPILAVSSSNDQTRRIELLTLGASDFIGKPFLDAEFSARVKNLVTSKQLFDQVKEQREQLYEMATTDQLTGLQNRHSLTDISKKYLSESKRHNIALSLLVIDLDHFKLVNDNHGHDKGDLVLAKVSELLKQSVREEDVVARFGGEEFVVLLHHCELEGARIKAESIREKIEALKPGELLITASIGVAEYERQKNSSFTELFKVADKAVYSSKENGRNQVTCA